MAGRESQPLKRKAREQLDNRVSKRRVPETASLPTTVELKLQPESSDGRQQPLIWSLPTELLLMVAELLGGDDLYTLSCVCARFACIAGPLYIANRGLALPPPSGQSWLNVSGEGFSALSVWRRSISFCPVSVAYFWFSGNPAVTTREMAYLKVFFSSLPSTPSIRSLHICLWSSVDPYKLLDLLQSVRQTGCSSFSFDFSTCAPLSDVPTQQITQLTHNYCPRLSVFKPASSIFFSSQVLDFTIATANHSPIKDLSLLYTGMSPLRWSEVLQHLLIPTLEILQIDCHVPGSALHDFLKRHPTIRELSIIRTTDSHPFQIEEKLELPNLIILSGPVSCIHTVLDSLIQPPDLRILGISPDSRSSAGSADSMEEYLRCTAKCARVKHLSIELPAEAHDPSFFAIHAHSITRAFSSTGGLTFNLSAGHFDAEILVSSQDIISRLLLIL